MSFADELETILGQRCAQADKGIEKPATRWTEKRIGGSGAGELPGSVQVTCAGGLRLQPAGRGHADQLATK